MTAPVPASGHYDALVVGAGPAGATTAAELARRGIRVLLVGPTAPAGAFAVTLPRSTAAALVELGALAWDDVTPVDAVDLRVGADCRPIPRVDLVACDGRALAVALRAAARRAGAADHEGTAVLLGEHDGAEPTAGDAIADHDDAGADPDDPGRRDREEAPVRALVDGREVSAPHAIIATGSLGDEIDGYRYAWRVATASPPPTGRMRIAFTAPDPAEPRARPLTAWLLPGPDGLVTLGMTRFGAPGEASDDELFAAAAATVGAPADLVALGPPSRGPLGTGFTPARSRTATRLTVGDAAGLGNPFTGEGLSRAIDSGRRAAAAVASCLEDPARARRAYARGLAATHVGHQEASRRAADRYHLTWRMLAAAVRGDHPFLTRLGRAVVVPDGPPLLAENDAVALTDREFATVGPFLLACDEVALSTVRAQWPFLAGMSAGTQRRLRPALLFAAGLAAGGGRPEARHATFGAAVELATLGTMAFLGHVAAPAPRRGVDWATATCTIAGDFLLAQATRLVAEAAPEMSLSFADWLVEIAAARAARLDPRDGASASAAAVFAELLEYPARVGATLGGASPEVVAAMREAGHQCGTAFLHAEDVLALTGGVTRLGMSLETLVATGISATPAGAALADPQGRARALATAAAACRRARDRADEALRAVPDATAVRLAAGFAAAVAAPGGPDVTVS